MDNKDLILTAIDSYPKLNGSQKHLLKILANFDTEVNAQTIIEVMALKKQSVYPNLKKLLKLNLIYKSEGRNAFFSINKNTIDEIINFYYRKQEILQNSSIK